VVQVQQLNAERLRVTSEMPADRFNELLMHYATQSKTVEGD
jgi:hypothetical protein